MKHLNVKNNSIVTTAKVFSLATILIVAIIGVIITPPLTALASRFGGGEEEEENATITFVLLTRTNPDGSGSGTSVTYFSTNSTGQLAFLDNMVAIGQVEYSPEEGINRFAEWEWKGGTLPFENLIPQP